MLFYHSRPGQRRDTSPGGDLLRIALVEAQKTLAGAVLVLPGGKPVSSAPSSARQLANVRMTLLSAALRRRLGRAVQVVQVRYRVRGWNAPQLDPVRDAELVLDGLLERFEPGQIVLIGHSMGARVAAHLAARRDVGGVVALAPWWPTIDGDLIPAGTRLLTVHGTADTWTDPASSRRQCERAAKRGVDAQWVGIPGAGHYMLRGLTTWNSLTAQFVRAQLSDRKEKGRHPGDVREPG